MAITTDSAKIHFNIGSFNADTTLDVPSDALKNKLYLDIQKEIGEQLTNWDSDFWIGVVLKITFEGAVLYKNPEFDNATFSADPVDPDLKIYSDPPTPQEITNYRNFYMILGNDGVVSNGKYTIESKFVFFNLSGLWAFDEATFVANLNYERKKPILSEWYDQGTPSMTVSDAQSYILGSISATVDTEFVLYPPLNKTAITNTFTDVQNVTYGSYWTGGNEINYTALIVYNFPSYIITTLEAKYDSFVVYFLDWCGTYNCLSELYNSANAENCSVKNQTVMQKLWLKATSLIQQIQLGLGCGKESISAKIAELNDTLDCECGCLDETPREITPINKISIGDVQIIEALTADTEVDLNLGKVSFINLDIGGATTEISAINIDKYGEYRFLFKNTSQDPTMTATFTSQFQDAAGTMVSVAVGNGLTVIVDFFAISDTVLQLVSRSDA